MNYPQTKDLCASGFTDNCLQANPDTIRKYIENQG